MSRIEIITIYCENYKKIKEVPCGKERGVFLKFEQAVDLHIVTTVLKG